MKDVDISIQNLSKIEGHANLDVRVRNGRVEDVNLALAENKRFFTQAIRGKSVDTLAQNVARICGTCSIAHTMCCLEAIENAFQVTLSQQTTLLKQLTMHGLMIRDHALHVYLFSLPDVFGKDSVLDFDKKESKFLYDSFAVKRAGNKLCKAVAGRAVHAPFPQVGGFASIPGNKELKEIAKELKKAREKIFDVLDIYLESGINYTRETKFVALVNKNFDYLGGDVTTNDGQTFNQKQYIDHLEKTEIPYSQAMGYKFRGQNYMVGALARLNLGRQFLHKNTKKGAKKYLRVFPSNNIFHNNLAQGVEILHSIDSSISTIENFEFKDEEPAKYHVAESEGVGVIEAPRGILFYRLQIDKDGIIKEGNIIVPTQQNQINIEGDIKKIVETNIDGMSKEDLSYSMEKLIRAYDPCISCASHFLKVNWV